MFTYNLLMNRDQKKDNIFGGIKSFYIYKKGSLIPSRDCTATSTEKSKKTRKKNRGVHSIICPCWRSELNYFFLSDLADYQRIRGAESPCKYLAYKKKPIFHQSRFDATSLEQIT